MVNTTKGGLGNAPPQMPNVPTHLTKEVANFDQLQERLIALGNAYNASEQLCCAFGEIVIPGNGGGLMWYARTWFFGGNQQIADVTGPTLETVINRAIEDTAYNLALISGSGKTRVSARTTEARTGTQG
jgi:hypothetical protein